MNRDGFLAEASFLIVIVMVQIFGINHGRHRQPAFNVSFDGILDGHRRTQALPDRGSFQLILNKTRAGLAKHYLKHSATSGAEIAFLPGLEDPNSFFRAFQSWTGNTPERARTSMRRN